MIRYNITKQYTFYGCIDDYGIECYVVGLRIYDDQSKPIEFGYIPRDNGKIDPSHDKSVEIYKEYPNNNKGHMAYIAMVKSKVKALDVQSASKWLPLQYQKLEEA